MTAPVDGRPRWVGLGTGRCGTTYLADLATALGSNTAHEDPIYWCSERGAGSGWADYDGCVSLASVAYADEFGDDWPLVHVARDPLAVARSFLGIRFYSLTCDCRDEGAEVSQAHGDGAHLRTPYVRFLGRHLDAEERRYVFGFDPAKPGAWQHAEPGRVGELRRVVRYLIVWTRKIDELDDSGRDVLRVRVEDLAERDSAVRSFAYWIGLRPSLADAARARAKIAADTNHRTVDESLGWDEVLDLGDEGLGLLELAQQWRYVP